MQQYFINIPLVVGSNITIPEGDSHHIKNVMRMNIGDYLFISNEEVLVKAKIENIDSLVNVLICEEINKITELDVNVTIAQGLVRREKMEEVIDYISELGACSYLPVLMERSIVKLSKDDFNKKIDRLNKISKEACEQAHRIKKLKVEHLINFKELLGLSNNYDLCLVAYEKEDVSKTLEQVINLDIHSILVLVGPEGGVSDNELKMLLECGFKAISLGPRILRTQVAPYYIMSAISVIKGGK